MPVISLNLLRPLTQVGGSCLNIAIGERAIIQMIETIKAVIGDMITINKTHIHASIKIWKYSPRSRGGDSKMFSENNDEKSDNCEN